MGKKKESNKGEFDFIFRDKADIEEGLFADLYSFPEINNPQITYKPPDALEYLECTSKVFDPKADLNKIIRELKSKAKKEEPYIYYGASYYYDGSLRISNVITGKEISDAWQVFYGHATFKEILKDIEHIFDIYTMDYTMDDGKIDFKRFLHLIQNYPHLLFDEKIVYHLIALLKDAKWSPDKKKRKEVSLLLRDCLIPLHPGGKKQLPSSVAYARELLKKLTLHLSKKCKEGVNVYLSINCERGQRLDKDDYKTIVNHAREIKHYRISVLSYDALNNLIFQPSAFAENLIKNFFQISKRTLMRKCQVNF